MDSAADEAWLEELSSEACLSLLQGATVGRIAVVAEEFPVILPVNYRFIDSDGRPLLVLRTRPGDVIDQAPMSVAFEIDDIDPVRHEGWSVLVRGNLRHIRPPAAEERRVLDSEPWLTTERDAWLCLEPIVISGRRLHAPPVGWAFQIAAYL